MSPKEHHFPEGENQQVKKNEQEQKKDDGPHILSQTVYTVISFGQTVAIFLTIFCVFFMNFNTAIVPSGSMIPTLPIGTVFLYRVTSYQNIDYDDIVVFFPHANPEKPIHNGFQALYYHYIKKETIFVKRVVGLPGDTLEVKDGYLYRNGEKLDPEYVPELMEEDMEPISVPEGTIFCMGDNRNNSTDSRYYGPFPQNAFFGKMAFILMR